MRHYAEKLRKRGADLTYIKATEMEKPIKQMDK
jgi:deoxyribodipyrimidine photolyase-related protein